MIFFQLFLNLGFSKLNSGKEDIGNPLMESSAPKSGITRPTETPEDEKTVMNKI